jgi:hypothetical protein
MNQSDNEIIWIASFDIGKCNFAFCVEEINLSLLKSINNIKKEDRYNVDGTCKPKFELLLKNIYLSGKCILLRNYDLTEGTDKDKYFDTDICYNLFDTLDEYQEYWNKLSYVIVEKQMAFGKKINTMALKLGQSCQSYFMMNYGRDLKVIEFPAYYKTLVLGAPQTETKTKTGKVKYKTLGDRERKKWAVEEAFGILSLRNDYETMSQIGIMKKRDDVSDVCIQLQAFKYLYFIEKMKL